MQVMSAVTTGAAVPLSQGPVLASHPTWICQLLPTAAESLRRVANKAYERREHRKTAIAAPVSQSSGTEEVSWTCIDSSYDAI